MDNHCTQIIPVELPFSLPHLVLVEIFSEVPTSDVLHSCRLVSKSWRQYATTICRNRHVKVKQLGDSENVSDYCIHDTFSKESDPPWSAVDLKFDADPKHRKFCAQICEVFGSHIRSLTSDVQPSEYDNFVRGLQRMGKLQDLEIILPYAAPADKQSFTFPPPGNIMLPKLEWLKIGFTEHYQNVDILEFLMRNTGSSLNTLSLNTRGSNEDPENEIQKMAELIYTASQRIPNMALEVSCAQKIVLKFLADQRNFRVDELVISIFWSSPLSNAVENFPLMRRFLENCVGLQTLSLGGFEVPTGCLPLPTSKLFQFPVLRDLVKLNISINPYNLERDYNEDSQRGHNLDPQYPLVYFNLLKSTDFPNLRIVHLGDAWLLRVDIRKLFDPSTKPFDTVKCLSLGSLDGGEGKFSTIFPNVNKIKVIIEKSTQLGSILDGMEYLTDLDLILNNCSDNNSLLNKSYKFIGKLKMLQKLTVRSCDLCESDALEESGLIVLQLLHPLNLIIRDSELKESDRCVSILRAAHLRLKVL